MRILITGANGYLGQGIVAKMAQRTNEVVATDMMLQNVESNVEKIEWDFLKEALMKTHLVIRLHLVEFARMLCVN